MGPTLSHFSMQERQFSSTSGGTCTGISALQGSRAASPRGSSPTGYTTTRAHFGLAQLYSSKVVSQPQSCQVDNPPWLETVTRPVLDFPETNLLDDLSLVRHQCSPNILACRITHFYQNWEKLTKNPWVLQQVMGHKIEFHSEPFQSHQPVTECSQQEAPLMQREIKLLLAKGAIIPITQPPAEQGFISTVFLVPKKDGGARPVINLRALNHFISSQHFKMEGVHLLKNLIQSGGPQGCLFYSTHPSDSPKVPKVHMEARDLSIHMPPVRPQFSPTSIHQAHETGEWLSSKQKSKECGVYRRHTADSTISRTPQTTHTCNLEFVSSTRVPSKLPKVPADPYSEHNIPKAEIVPFPGPSPNPNPNCKQQTLTI